MKFSTSVHPDSRVTSLGFLWSKVSGRFSRSRGRPSAKFFEFGRDVLDSRLNSSDFGCQRSTGPDDVLDRRGYKLQHDWLVYIMI